MPGNDDFCQIETPKAFSTVKVPYPCVKFQRLMGHIRKDGFRWTFAWIVRSASRRVRAVLGLPDRARRPAGARRSDEILNLRPGEWVEVKSEQEIAETLDEDGKFRGLAFLPEMRPFCGRRFPVYKRLEVMFMEESRQKRSVKNTVLLSGVVCEGGGYECDRSCLFYWREVWLRKVDLPPVMTVER